MKKALLTYALVFFATTIFAQVSEKEKQILLDFYHSTNGADWNQTWDLTKPVHEWPGITVENNTVIGISLLFNNINGTLPASLGELENLKVLELSFNPITGTLPSSLGNLEELEILALNGANLSGEIPVTIGNLSHLRQLHLSSNQFSGELPENLGNLKNIEVFNVFDNQLTGEIPSQLVRAQNLKELMVAENGLKNSGEISVILLSQNGASVDLEVNKENNFSRSVIALETEEDN